MLFCICQLCKETDAVFEDLWRWFNSLCNCDGYNIIRIRKLDCINYTTGQVTTVVSSGDDQSAQMLIDLMVADIEGSSPPVISMKSDWVICLTPNCNWTFNSDVVGSGMQNEVLLYLYVKNMTDCHQVLNVSNLRWTAFVFSAEMALGEKDCGESKKHQR